MLGLEMCYSNGAEGAYQEHTLVSQKPNRITAAVISTGVEALTRDQYVRSRLKTKSTVYLLRTPSNKNSSAIPLSKELSETLRSLTQPTAKPKAGSTQRAATKKILASNLRVQ